MTRHRLPLWLLSAALLTVGALIAWWTVKPIRTRVKLPDGTEVSLLGTTYGVDHRFALGDSWIKAFFRQIFRGSAFRLGSRQYRHLSDGTNLLIWTYWEHELTNRSTLFASVRDQHGIESEPIVPTVFAPLGALGSPETVIAWQFKNFPRRQSEIQLTFYSRDVRYQPVRLGEIVVPNPISGPYPEWPAAEPPVLARQDDIEFSLLELRCGEAVPEAFKAGRGFVAPWTSAVFAVKTNGHTDPAWRIRRLDAQGATGNSFSLLTPGTEKRGDRIVTGFANVLWPDEPAWRLVVEFSRQDHFTTEETWTVRAVPFRSGGSTVLTNPSVTAQGITLSNLVLSPLPSMQIRPGRDAPNGELKLAFTEPPEGFRVDLYRAIDNRGRELSHQDGHQFPASTYTVRIRSYPDTESVDLIFAVRQSRFAEFLVRPSSVVTNSPSALPAAAKAATNSLR